MNADSTVASAAAPTDEDSFRTRAAYARRRLAQAQKSSAAVAAYLRYVNRPLGGRLACLAYALRLTPSQVSLLSMLASTIGFLVLAVAPSVWITGLVAAIVTAFGYALDSADGQLARIRGGGTPAGEWLDHVLDMVKTVLLHSCVLIALYRNFDLDAAWLLVPLVFLLAQGTQFFAVMLRDALRMQRGLSRQPASTHNSVRSALVLLPFDHGTLCWSFALLGWPAGFLGVYTALAVVSTLFAARALLRSHANLIAIGREDSS